jgi:hypothetical protein
LPNSCSGLFWESPICVETRASISSVACAASSELERRVDSGEMAVAFAMYPTPMADLMAVADAGQVMPPKSTWFEPKLADGLVSLLLDPAEGSSPADYGIGSAGLAPDH